jgi:parvulin-like peptidyl-prolyl isomerase
VNQRSFWLIGLMMILAACSTPATPPPAPPVEATAAPTTAVKPAAPAATPTAAAKPAAPGATPSPASKVTLVCPPVTASPTTTQVAARVNGQPVSLDLYNRQAAQAQAAMIQNGGLDPNSAQGKEAIKSLKQQVLEQMIDDVVIAQQADREGIKATDAQVNQRLAEMVVDAGSADKLNEYLTKNQLTLADLCYQIRSQILGDAMLNRVTGALPANVPQVRARHILMASAQQAQAVREQIRQGKDFADLAKQYSVDEATKVNGGDLGWFPKGVMDPQFETIAFQMRPGEVSNVVQTQFGYHIIKLEEKQDARALPPELIQNARQQAFLAWLQAVRETLKIERLITP